MLYEVITVIILSIHKKEAYVCQAIEDGAHGYVVKPALTPGVVDAIRLVHDNGYFLGSGVNYESVRLLVQKNRITSYNVCYTKLLRCSGSGRTG